jgi:hypothetical protein
LYVDVLYEIVNEISKDVSKPYQESLISYVKKAFEIRNMKHEKYLKTVKGRSPPSMKLNVEVISGIDLGVEDGWEDFNSFLSVYLSSDTKLRHRTTVQTHTISPVWNENFSIDLSENYLMDQLIVELWQLQEYVPGAYKARKYFTLRNVREMRKMSKMARRKNFKDIIGRFTIPLHVSI